MSSSYNTPCIKHKLVVSIYSNTETSLAMSTLAIWCRIIQSRDVSPHNFDGLAMSGLAFSVTRPGPRRNVRRHTATQRKTFVIDQSQLLQALTQDIIVLCQTFKL